MSELHPHKGPQHTFLGTAADIAIYGGAAGGGKTWALVAEAARHIHNPEYRGIIFRRTGTQVKNPGGLWDETTKLYPLMGGKSREYLLEWTFPSGAEIKFAHMEHEGDKFNYQGGQFAFIGWDELTHFMSQQFWYLLSRSRSTSGIRPYIRATCNPDADSWVANLISWWIDPKTGLAIPSRSGVRRWFYRVNDQVEWYSSEAEAMAAHPDLSTLAKPKSLTFVAAKLTDNPTLTQADPGYLANLLAMPLVDRERLLEGNWKIRLTSGNFFKREWLTQFVDAVPSKCRWARYWDKAGGVTEAADRSCGVKVGLSTDGCLYIADVVAGRWSPLERNKIMLATADMDRRNHPDIEFWIEEEFGHNAKEVKAIHAKLFARYAPRFDRVNKAKALRAKPLAAQAEAGNVYLVRAPWNEDFINELVSFPTVEGMGHDDCVDGASGATNKLLKVDETVGCAPRGSIGGQSVGSGSRSRTYGSPGFILRGR